MQIFIDLELRDASFSERASFYDRILELDESFESQIQYRGGRAIEYLLHGDTKAAEAQLASILDEYGGEAANLSPYGRQKLLDTQETLGTITGDKRLLRKTASELSATLQAEKWTDFGRSNLFRQIGDCYRYAQEWDLAVGAYEEAIELSGSVICCAHLAECFLYQKKVEKAVQQIESVQLDRLNKYEMMDFIFTYSAISIWCENLEMLGKAKDWLKTLEAAEPLFNERRLNLLVRVTETSANGFATIDAKADSTPEEGVAGAARVLLLQPNFFGLGINFNEIVERFSRRKKVKPLAIEHQEPEDKEP
ncbi:MAG: hypothetical protein Rhims3KO_18110 [Hyphomicrobiales bacterium]